MIPPPVLPRIPVPDEQLVVNLTAALGFFDLLEPLLRVLELLGVGEHGHGHRQQRAVGRKLERLDIQRQVGDLFGLASIHGDLPHL